MLNVKAEDLYAVYTIDLSHQTKIFEALYSNYFDEDYIKFDSSNYIITIEW